jgi:hypothetical protein
LTQMLATETPDFQIGLIDYLAGLEDAEATVALARLAIFSPEPRVQRSAIDALRNHDSQIYTQILLSGLRYPWPAAAERAADALVALGCTDVVPQLVRLLDEPDPRAPMVQNVEGKKTTIVRELVRINHHRNCLLCHAPPTASDFKEGRAVPLGAVPDPDRPLQLSEQGYPLLSPDLLVRADVTYLRQDFSALQEVADAAPWPAMQRFDFLVRTRTLNSAEADAVNDALAKSTGPNPYRQAALHALRWLTGTDAGATAAGWRRWQAGKISRFDHE